MPARRKSAVTMDRIADLAKVSKATVSRALDDDPRVNAKTKARIKEIARRLDYHPNLAAVGLARRRTHTVGLVIPSAPRVLSDPFYLEFLGGAGDFALKQGYNILLSPMADEAPGHVSLLASNRVDGLILTEPQQNDPRVPYLKDLGVPFVFLGQTEAKADAIWVDGDNVGGARMAVEHLIALGHERIGCITGPMNLVAAGNRLAGYIAALTAKGIPYDSQLVAESDFTEPGGRRAMERLLALDPRPTAVFAGNDLVAIGAINAARERGLSIPGDLALVGFDGIRSGELVIPKLTTVIQPIYRLGWLAGELLIKAIRGEEIAVRHVLLPLDLCIRESCGAHRPEVENRA
ncbi:MAG: LacI family DNA-binding transcriptional regulator [Bacteroidota bacterium]